MNNEPIAWKAFEEVNLNDKYIMRWIREGDVYVNRINKEMMEEFKSLMEKELTEPSVKELTDEEILEIAKVCLVGATAWNNPELDPIEFAKAILKKAQEK